MIWLFYIILTIVGTLLHMLIAKTPFVYTLLLYILIIEVGVSGIVAFLAHAFNADKIAKYIGWSAGSPFQYEVACANLSYGTLGVLCIWLRGNFWVATAIACSVFLLGAGIGHIKEIIRNKNFAPGNAGFPLYSDFIKPVIIWVLLIIYKLH